MLQGKQRLLQLNAKLAETLASKGVTATADETTTSLVNKVGDIASGDTIYFSNDGRMHTKSIILPEGISTVGWNSYKDCTKLESVIIPVGVKSIEQSAFQNCINLKKCIIGHGVNSISINAFYKCNNLEVLFLPNTITAMHTYCYLTSSAKLTEVVLEDGFNYSLILSASTRYSRETIVSWLNALADRTGQTAYKLTIGAKNLAKLTEEDILIATNKNWTLA